MPIIQGLKTQVIGYQELVVAGSVVMLTVPRRTDAARLVFVAGPISYTLDGTTPTASVGMEGSDGYVDTVSAHAVGLAQFIRIGSTNGTVKAVFLAFA